MLEVKERPIGFDGRRGEVRAMAHYCYLQGVLYSNKTSKLCCEVHSGFQEVYGNEPTRLNQEHLEIAEMYSTFSYVKLLNLCFTRLLKDSLYGHNYNEKEDVYQNAKDLLDLSVINYNKVVNPISESVLKISEINEIDSVAEEAKTVSPETITVAEAAKTVSPETIPVAEAVDIISPETTPVLQTAMIPFLETISVPEAANTISPETIPVAEASNTISPETIPVAEAANIISPETIPVAEASNIISPETITVLETAKILCPETISVPEAANIISLEAVIMDEVTKVVEECKESQDSSNLETIQKSGTFEVLLDLLLKSEEPLPESEIETSVSKTPGIGENYHKLDGAGIEDDIQVVEGPLRPHETRKSLSDLLSTQIGENYHKMDGAETEDDIQVVEGPIIHPFGIQVWHAKTMSG